MSFVLVFTVADSLINALLKPFRVDPKQFARRLGVIPTILFSAFVRQTSSLYDYIGNQPGLGHFLNVGWWNEPDSDWAPDEHFSMTDQCETLVHRVAETADLDGSRRLLDVGFGYGEQDRIFLSDYDVGEIIGLNITPSQVKQARSRVQEDRFGPHVGDAVTLPYGEETFDRIIALESPFHFHTRRDFLGEAARVLEPGGRIVITDIINGRAKGEAPLPERLFSVAHNTYWQVDRDNYCTMQQYDERMTEAGFSGVSISDVTDRTLKPGITRYIRWRTSQQPDWLQTLMTPVVQWGLDFYRSGYLRYVIVSARKNR